MNRQHNWVTYLKSRLRALWVLIEQADAEGDEYHVTLRLGLADKLEVLIVKAQDREEAR